MEFSYKINNNLKTRKKQYSKLAAEHPDKVPIILERDINCTINKPIKSKYILSKGITMSEFVKIIREKLELKPERAIFLLVNGKHSVTLSEELGNIYNKYKDENDGFLYMSYSEEIVYG